MIALLFSRWLVKWFSSTIKSRRIIFLIVSKCFHDTFVIHLMMDPKCFSHIWDVFLGLVISMAMICSFAGLVSRGHGNASIFFQLHRSWSSSQQQWKKPPRLNRFSLPLSAKDNGSCCRFVGNNSSKGQLSSRSKAKKAKSSSTIPWRSRCDRKELYWSPWAANEIGAAHSWRRLLLLF